MIKTFSAILFFLSFLCLPYERRKQSETKLFWALSLIMIKYDINYAKSFMNILLDFPIDVTAFISWMIVDWNSR